MLQSFIDNLPAKTKKQLQKIGGGRPAEEVIKELIEAEFNKTTMTAAEAAAYLCMDVSLLYKKIKARQIPAHKPFGTWIFYRSELDEIIARSRHDTEEELARKAAQRLA